MHNQYNGLTDTYTRITGFVLEQLEKGEVIWRKGWNELGLPKNISTAHIYKGWNSFLLNFITVCNGFKTPYFITYKQAMDAGGTIRRGQKGFTVVYWATIENKSKIIEVDGEEEYLTYRIPKCHTVFNIDQTHGIVFPKVEKEFRSHTEKIYACEKIIDAMPQKPAIINQGDEASYDKKADRIFIPPAERFHSDEDYYKTLFHELAHSTGHQKRLNRNELVSSDGFGNELYSKEELTAELTAAFLCAMAGIGQRTLANSAAYIKGWLKVLRDDKKLILKAATQAQAAADYILNKSLAGTIQEPTASSTI
ncbi:MAG TPA: zincin-like metallopeptidase domain-containing protein [Puia sp.]|nr:zincin-like metallopeptidase domain-containing protein [Puia sp.]